MSNTLIGKGGYFGKSNVGDGIFLLNRMRECVGAYRRKREIKLGNHFVEDCVFHLIKEGNRKKKDEMHNRNRTFFACSGILGPLQILIL